MSYDFRDIEDDAAYGQPIARTTSAGVHPYASSTAAVNTALPPSQAGSQTALAAAAAAPAGTAAAGEGVRPEDVPQQQPAPKPPLYKRKWFIITSIVLALLGIAILFILLYPVIHAIAQHIVNVSVLNVDQTQIRDPTNTSFDLTMDAWVSHAGIFSATITFNQALSVAWRNASGDLVTIGSFNLSPLKVKSKRAYINQTTTFTIEDEDAFSQFTSAMITQPNFTWHLSSSKLSVRALAFPTAHDLTFSKDITLSGMNNFDNQITLLNFLLPSDDPSGGIYFSAETGLSNPSAFNVDLGTVVFDLSYQGLYLGSGSSPNTIIAPGGNNITLNGTLIPQNGTQNLATMSTLFTNYLNGVQSDVVATGKSSTQNDGSTVSWLSAGLTSLQMHVPFKPASAINTIKAITIGNMGLAFTPQTEWSPITNSQTVQAALELPFGFNLAIGEISNSFNITTDAGVVGGLSTPESAATSEIQVINSTFTQGVINITIDNTALEVPEANHAVFSSFNRNLTDSAKTPFQLEGHARAVANMSIGQITLDPINFNVTSGLQGLQGLNNMVQIQTVDVLGGSTGAIHLGIGVNIFNPSSLQLDTGDMTLQLFRGDALLGTTLLPNLTLQIGNNSLTAQGNFTPNGSPEGLDTLDSFVGGTDVQVLISGYSDSTAVDSLLPAFESLNISAMLPGLQSKLLRSASLEVLSTTGHENDTAHTVVTLANPFTSDLVITKVQSDVTFKGITLGTIDMPVTFASEGNSTTESPNLDLNMNMDPASLFTVTRILALEAGESTDQLDAIVALGGYTYLNNVTARAVEKRDNMFTGFDLPTYVDKAFTELAADIQLTAGVNIGDYATTLTYNQTSVPVKTDSSLNLILPILAQPIVQKIVTGSVLGIDTVLIKDIQEETFGTTLSGSITNAGPFDATISFPSGLTIEWNGQMMGSISMPDVDVVGDVGANFSVDATFNISSTDVLASFTKVMLTEESFDWVISGNNLSVAALGISVPGISLSDKSVTLKGMNSLKNGVVINSFDLPNNDPAGGIHLTLNTSVTNPSQVGVELTSIAFENFFQNVNIGPASTNDTFTLAAQSTVPLALTGRLIPQSSQTGLDAVSAMFNSFIHGQDSNIVVQGASAGPTDVTWLNSGIQALQVQTVLPNQGVLQIIKSISLNELDLQFTEATAFDPAMSTDDTTAAFTLPFAFPVDIVALEQNITVGSSGTDFAQLIIPKGPSTTDVDTRIIHLGFSNVPFAVVDGQQSAFEQFLADTATSKNVTMSLKGAANTDASTAVGILTLTDIAFDVDSTIAGLQGLDAAPTIVTSLDVYQGFSSYLLIKVNSSLYNPSNITLGSGDIAFNLAFNNAVIGTADLTNLVILPGNQTYPIDVHYQPTGSAVASGQLMLENYLQGVESATTIEGNTDSTAIESLQLAMSKIEITPVNIPALHQNLIGSASLEFPTDIASTGLASTAFTLANPFTASINLLEVNAVATFGNLTLGKIDHVDRSSDPIHADGHSNITSPTLPFEFNLDPVTIIELLYAGATNNGVDLGPLPGVFAIVLDNPNTKTSINATIDTSKPTCVSGNQFDVNDAILDSLKNLEVTLAIDSSVKIDDYATDLSFNQYNVSAITDDTALYLISVVAPPIVQALVDNATLSFNVANITNISNEGFDLSLQGSLTGTGPFDAEIAFVEPVVVTWEGHDIATITLPAVCAGANDGVPTYSTNGHLTITDNDQFTAYATYLLHNPSFTWTISTDALRVTALGTIFDGVKLSKDISFKAFDNLPGVTISNFQMPSDDPAGGIHIETDSMVPSSAQLGIELGTVTFEAAYKGTDVGPLSGENFFLAPDTTTNLHLSGRITPKTGDDLDVMGELFTNYLHAENQTLTVTGMSVQPDGSTTVDWLSTAFKTLTLSVILPGQSFEIIQSIDMDDLELVITEDSEAFAPIASAQYILSTYKNPFGFSLQVIKSGEDFTLAAGGVNVATLNLPQMDAVGGVSTGNVVDLVLNFQNQTLHSANNDAFAAFFAAVTDTSGIEYELNGDANVVARTPVGDLPITAIPFNVTSSLKGINGYNGVAALTNVTITGGGTDSRGPYITSPLETTLENPSNVSLLTNDIDLPIYYQDVLIGRAVIDEFNLVPGENTVSTEFRYQPTDSNDTTAQAFLTEFLLTADDISLAIKGDEDSSPYASVVPGLEALDIIGTLKGIDVTNFVSHINAYLTLETLLDNLISIDFDISNPFDTDLQILFTQVDSGVNNETYAFFASGFDSFVIPARSTANSGTVENVLLTQGAIASLGIIGLGELDVFTAVTVKIGDYTIPWLQIVVRDVPTTYSLDISLTEMKEKAAAMSAASVSATLSTPGSANSSAASSSVSGTGSTTGGNSAVTSNTSAGDPSSAANTPSPSSSVSMESTPTAATTTPETSPSNDSTANAPLNPASSADAPASTSTHTPASPLVASPTSATAS